MVIAVNICSLPGQEAWNVLMEATMLRLAERYPQLQIVFISDRPTLPEKCTRNVMVHTLQRRSQGLFALRWWYNFRLPPLLRSLKATMVLQCGGVASMSASLPQCLLFSDSLSPERSGWLSGKYKRLIHKRLPGFLNKSSLVLTPGVVTLNYVAGRMPNATGKLQSWIPLPEQLPPGIDRESLKEAYAGGNEYFVCQATIHPRSNLLLLLKAFSLFKKRMKSSMRLVVVTDQIPVNDEWVESLRTYKYRNDVNLVEVPLSAKAAMIVGGAYACIQLSPLPAELIRIQVCWQAGVPIIAANEPVSKELMGEGSLLCDIDDPIQLAETMMQLYKDETMCKILIEKGKSLWQQRSNANTDTTLYQLLTALPKT